MAKEKNIRDLGCVRCIEGANGKVLVEELKIRERWGVPFLGYLMARGSPPDS